MKSSNYFIIFGIIILILILPKLELFSISGQYDVYGDCIFMTNVHPVTQRFDEKWGYRDDRAWVSIDYDNDGDFDAFSSTRSGSASLDGSRTKSCDKNYYLTKLLVENYNSEGDDIYYSEIGGYKRLYFCNPEGNKNTYFNLNPDINTPSTCEICIPKTCEDLNKECGIWGDTCFGNLDCGSCNSGEECYEGLCFQKTNDVITKISELEVNKNNVEFLLSWRGGTSPYSLNIDWGNGDSTFKTWYNNNLRLNYGYDENGEYKIEACVSDSLNVEDCKSIIVDTSTTTQTTTQDTDTTTTQTTTSDIVNVSETNNFDLTQIWNKYKLFIIIGGILFLLLILMKK